MSDSDQSAGRSGSDEDIKAYLQFAKRIAHDLNNTLFPILTGAELILEDTTDDKVVSETASDIKESSEKAIELLKDFISKTQSFDPK